MGRFGKNRLTAEEREAIRLKRHLHLRQIKNSYLHKEPIHGPFFHAGDPPLATFLALLKIKGPILAACNERHARRLATAGYKFIWQVDEPIDPEDVLLGKVFRKPEAQGALKKFKFSAPLKGAFVCERLQKQENLHDYLVALRLAVEIDAPVCIVVPNVHHELVQDHVNLFTAGTLVYNMIRAGWNCKDAKIYFDRRFINLILRRVDLPEPLPKRIEDFQPYVPFKNIFNFCSSEFPEVYRE